MPRRLVFAVSALFLAIAGVGRATAQLPSGVLTWPGLPQDDLDRMGAASARLYEGRSIGTVERWRNPDTQDAGEVKLIRDFDTHGMPCRTLDYTIRFNEHRDRPDHYVLTWCRISEGTWKIVEVPGPR